MSSLSPSGQGNKPAHEIILVKSDDKTLTEQCKEIRIKGSSLVVSPNKLTDNPPPPPLVFVDEQKFPLDAEIDEYDDPGQSVHFLLRLLPSLEPIGTIRLVLAKGKVGRLCLLKDYRKCGFGRDLMVKCHQMSASEPGLSQTELYAQIPAMPFYAK